MEYLTKPWKCPCCGRLVCLEVTCGDCIHGDDDGPGEPVCEEIRDNSADCVCSMTDVYYDLLLKVEKLEAQLDEKRQQNEVLNEELNKWCIEI